LPEPDFPVDVGRCIYCGTDRQPLTKEHVVPLGLSGNWHLLRASCPRHSDMTSAFEGKVLRGGLLNPRVVMGLRTRHPRQRPKSLPVKLKLGWGHSVLTLEPSNHPGYFALPVFEPPGTAPLSGETPGIRVRELAIAHIRTRSADLRRQVDALRVSVPFPDLLAFSRMIAKIAYAFAVGCFGLDAMLASPVLAAIKGDDAMVGQWVGCLDDPPVNDASGVHAVTLVPAGQSLRAHVRILAWLRTPEYVVVLK